MIHLDTHVAMWLFLERFDRIPDIARARLEQEDVRLSPMAYLELAYLYEIERLVRNPADVVAALAAGIGLTISDTAFMAVVAHAVDVTWTRDPFDRLIVAHALADGAELLTADQRILANCAVARWDRDED